VLSIDPAYFAITGGRERWLYRVARKHAGGNGPKGFTISLPTLFAKSGAEGPFRRFKFEIQKIAGRNDLPGLFLSIEKTAGGEPALRMIMREEMGERPFPDLRRRHSKDCAGRPRPGPRSRTRPHRCRFSQRISPRRRSAVSGATSPAGMSTP
jgi:plasmid replication initiation protein